MTEFKCGEITKHYPTCILDDSKKYRYCFKCCDDLNCVIKRRRKMDFNLFTDIYNNMEAF